jgi:hypothetical protein
MRVHQFEVNQSKTFKFVKEEINFQVPNHQSSLAAQLAGQEQNKQNPVIQQPVSEFFTTSIFCQTELSFHVFYFFFLLVAHQILLTIYLAWNPNPVKVKVASKATVETVINLALKQNEEDTKDDINRVAVNRNPKALMLKFAEDDGTPDEDMPGRKQKGRIFYPFLKLNPSSSSGENTRDRTVQRLHYIRPVQGSKIQRPSSHNSSNENSSL